MRRLRNPHAGVQWTAFLLLLAGLTASGAAALAQQKPRTEEEEGKGKTPVRLEDEEPGRVGSAPALLREADAAKMEAVRALYFRLAVPHDELAFMPAQKDHWIVPLSTLTTGAPPAGMMIRPLESPRGKLLAEKKLPPGVTGVVPYERVALNTVAAFLETAKVSGPPRPEALRHAERVLADVLLFHEAARERRQRVGPGWDDVERSLRAQLLVLRRDMLRAQAEARNWPAVAELASRLAVTYPTNPEIRTSVIQAHLQQAEAVLASKRLDTFGQARQSLDQLERLYPDSQEDKVVQALRGRLQKEAQTLAANIKELAGANKDRAREQLRLVEHIWPQTPELPALRRALGLDAVMYVGVHQLPTFFSPTTAATDAELRAMELLFESLMRVVPDLVAGQAYEPVLAASSPRLTGLGRQFNLVRDARWYRDGAGAADPGVNEPVTAADVHGAWQRFKNAPAVQELLAGDRIDGPFSLRLNLRQGYLDPLALMSFKVLPAKYQDDRDFARRPIGSGPYVYVGREKRGAPAVEYAVFRANPTYGQRENRKGLPLIREICFYSMQGRDARIDFKHTDRQPPHLHLLLDLPTDRIAELKSEQAGLHHVNVVSLPNRRVWFLAANLRHPQLEKEQVRSALGMAIDREDILKSTFRHGEKVHAPLTGPYPNDSWACNPSVKPLFDAVMARSLANQAGVGKLTLELKYPNDVPLVEAACTQIQVQVQKHTGIVLTLKGVSSTELRKAVEQDHDYQLAYCHWDHPDESYWLWPLFDPSAAGKGGSNFLGPTKNPRLDNLFPRALQYRQFGEVTALTHQIHAEIAGKMLLIPLWQLHTHLAIHQDLKVHPRPDQLDPLLIFTHVERWQLGK